MIQRQHSQLFPALCLCLPLVGGCHARSDLESYQAAARFVVSDKVVTPRLEAFTATIPGIGNSAMEIETGNSGFEPIVFRNMYTAQQNAENRLVVNADALTSHDSFREGFLDGAEVRIYRVESGRFRLVRKDRIPEGGSHASGWLSAMSGNQIVPANTPEFLYQWAGWNRPDAPDYFTVRAVTRDGRLSPPAVAVSFVRPARIGKPESSGNLMPFNAPGSLIEKDGPPAPTGLRGKLLDNGALRLEWDKSSRTDLLGYIVYRSDYSPQKQSGFYLDLTGKAVNPEQRIHVGDMAIVSKKLYSVSRKRYFSNRVWGAEGVTSALQPGTVNFFPDETPGKTWELVPHDAATPVSEPGETYLRLTLAAGQSDIVGRYNHSGTAQSWYPVLEPRPYRVEAWMRQQGSGSVRFAFQGFYGSGRSAIAPISFQVGPEWRKYVATFTPPVMQTTADPGRMGIIYTGPGTLDIDNLRVYRADAEFLDFLPEQSNELKSAKISALRTHGLIKTKFRTYDMAQLTNDGGAISGSMKSNSLPQLLRNMRKVAARPWLQIEFHMSPHEWLGLIEYLAAPYDPAADTPAAKPWAYKRYQQGQTRPWTEEFDRIYFELGNETWNGLFRPWTFGNMTDAATGANYNPGQTYGLFQEYVISILRGSPYWRSAGLEQKLSFVLGGWSSFAYGKDAARMSPSSQYMTVAAYNGGWDEGEGPPRLDAASFFNVLTQVNQAAIPVAEHHQRELRELNARRSVPLKLGTYEAGPGYALNGLNNARVSPAQADEQEQVMKSLAAGTATLDSFLARAYRGYDLQNYFTFGQGAYWTSHTPWHRGGHATPAWQSISLFNQQATGDMLETKTIDVPTTDLKPYERRKGIDNAPLAAVYATRQGSRYTITAISRKIPDYPFAGDNGFTPLSIELPFNRARKLTLYRMVGDPRANNLSQNDGVRIETIELGAWQGRQLTVDHTTGAAAKGLPPAAVLMYVFEDSSAKPAE